MATPIELRGNIPSVGLSNCTRLWIQEELSNLFGKVQFCKKPPTSGEPEKDVAFVTFVRQEDADKAMVDLSRGMQLTNGCEIIGTWKGGGKGGGKGGRGGNDRGNQNYKGWKDFNDVEDSRALMLKKQRQRSPSRRRSRSRSRSRRRTRSRSRGRGYDGDRRDPPPRRRSPSRRRSRSRRDDRGRSPPRRRSDSRRRSEPRRRSDSRRGGGDRRSNPRPRQSEEQPNRTAPMSSVAPPVVDQDYASAAMAKIKELEAKALAEADMS